MNEGPWILCAEANHRLVIRPGDLTYFQTHFVGKPMAEMWKPPPVTIGNKSLPLRDFVSWMVLAPVISEKARQSLLGLITEHCEILPLIELRRKQYYAVNVLTQVDCLDQAKCDILYSPTDPNRILSISRFYFMEDRIPNDVPIFKVPQYEGIVFATRRFVEAVRGHQLRGAEFLDPSVDPFMRLMTGPTDTDLDCA